METAGAVWAVRAGPGADVVSAAGLHKPSCVKRSENHTMIVLNVNQNRKAARSMLDALAGKTELEVIDAGDMQSALDCLGSNQAEVALVAEHLPDGSGKQCIEELTKVNPFMYCLMLSGMDKDDFHEETEGLGVLMQLPPEPGPEYAGKLLVKLQEIQAIMSGD
ncbi:MAG: hypothetical protein CSB24_00735 [Deltaproteobacteria bacterium]|nr:MAG: hypothetical protein CSB24_00735 [Deltaproteobacteria bacterium]